MKLFIAVAAATLAFSTFAFANSPGTVGKSWSVCVTEKDARALAKLAEEKGPDGYNEAIRDPDIECFDGRMNGFPPMPLTLVESVFEFVSKDGARIEFWKATDMNGDTAYTWIFKGMAGSKI